MSLILSDKALKPVCESISSRGEDIVLTHGAYDLLHVGHIEFLRRSKALGKYLFVGVDSDERICKYKNVSRPIISAQFRMEMLINLKFVDAVFLIDSKDFSDDYFFKLYSLVKPKVVTLGKPHAFSREVKDEIESLRKTDPFFKNMACKTIRHPYENVISTTYIIDKILDKYRIVS